MMLRRCSPIRLLLLYTRGRGGDRRQGANNLTFGLGRACAAALLDDPALGRQPAGVRSSRRRLC
jgi:hypothetical protein